MSMQYLSELERGRKEASSEILAAICDALEVDLPDVLAEVGRELASAGAVEHQAIVLRLRTGPDQLAQRQLAPGQLAPHQLAPSRPARPAPQAVVGLLAA
jgi:transcriptional regulator with XRE-family HTH domain